MAVALGREQIARDSILERNRSIVANNLNILDTFFADFAHLFDWYLPDGGSIGYPAYLGPEGIEAFAAELVERTGVLLIPSSIYKSDLGETAANRFRVGYGRANLPEAVEAMKAYLVRQLPAH